MMLPFRIWPFCLSFAAFFLAPHCASGMEARPYLTFRARSHYDRKLTYATVQADAGAYAGHVIELRGTVSGSSTDNDKTLIILSLADGSAVDLPIPEREMTILRQYSSPSLRVLARIGANASGNVVPFEVLAIAADSDVGELEAVQAAQEAARRAQAKAEVREKARRLLANNSRSSTVRGEIASRHAAPRTVPSSSPVGTNSAADGSPYLRFLSSRARPLFPAYQHYIIQQNPSLTVMQSSEIAASLLHFADSYGVDPRLIVAMIMAESHFNPQATSRHGAMGLGQLMPGTARALGINNAYDPVQNLQGSISYLRGRLDRFADHSLPGGGMTFEQVRLAMAAYNAGENAVRKYGGVPPYRETQAYVQRIERLYRELLK